MTHGAMLVLAVAASLLLQALACQTGEIEEPNSKTCWPESYPSDQFAYVGGGLRQKKLGFTINVYAMACYIDKAVALSMPDKFSGSSARSEQKNVFFTALQNSLGEKYIELRIVAPMTLSGSQMYEGLSESLKTYGVDDKEIQKIESSLGSSMPRDSKVAFHFNGSSPNFIFSVQQTGSAKVDTAIESRPLVEAFMKIYFGSELVTGLSTSILSYWGFAVKKLLPGEDGPPSLPLSEHCDADRSSCFPTNYPSAEFALGGIGVRYHEHSMIFGVKASLVVYSLAVYFNVSALDSVRESYKNATSEEFFEALRTSDASRSYVLRILPSGLPQTVKTLSGNSMTRTQLSKGIQDSLGKWLPSSEGVRSALKVLEMALPEKMPQGTFVVFNFPSGESHRSSRKLLGLRGTAEVAGSTPSASFDVQSLLPAGRMSDTVAIQCPELAQALQHLWFADCAGSGEDCIQGFRASLATHWPFLVNSAKYVKAVAAAADAADLPPAPIPTAETDEFSPWQLAILLVGCFCGGLCTCCGSALKARCAKTTDAGSTHGRTPGTELRGMSRDDVTVTTS